MPGDYRRRPGDAMATRSGRSVHAEPDDYEGDFVDEYDEDRPERRGCRNVLIACAILLVLAVLAAAVAWRWVQDKLDPAGPPGDTVLVEIPRGANNDEVGIELAEAGVIESATVWRWYGQFRDIPSVQAGTYQMRLNSSIYEAIDALENGPLPPDAVVLTVPEGFTVRQTLARIADPEDGVEGLTIERLQAVLAAEKARSRYLPAGQANVEGTLFPETYQLNKDDDEAAVLTRMVAQFDAVMDELGADAKATELGRSPYEVLIVASLVEEEARVADERPQVARVIYNRLARDEPLGIDATSCYEKGEIPCTLTESDLESDSPYNTRNRTGLPPTPIASPGRASIEAALNPADGDWLYYVLADEEGHHVFTASYDEFLEAREQCIAKGLGCG